MKAVELILQGLKCDAPGCGYTQPEPEGNDITEWEKWLHAPCPRCGESLLTQADFDTLKILLSTTEEVSKLLAPLMPETVDPKEVVNFRLEMDGSGSVTPKREEAE